MGKKINNPKIAMKSKNQNKKIRMAYTINNRQPVLCTMVSDQPFFYIDEEIQGDDDCLFADDFTHEIEQAMGDAGIDDPSLINELLAMKNKIDAYETISARSKNIDSRDDVLCIFKEQSNVLMNETPQKITNLDDVFTVLRKSQTAAFYLDKADQLKINIIQSNDVQTARYEPAAKTILISPHLSYEDQAILLTRELRRFWQDEQKGMINPLEFEPDDAVLVHRAQNADLDGAIIKTAWELRLAGEFDLWDRLESSSYADLARAFAREALSDFRTLNNGKAQAVLFETWFLSNRCVAADKDLINMMLMDYKDYVAHHQGEITCFDILCRLGTQPMGKNYLSGYATMVVNDTLFTEVRDRSNANFLWFIKFERNFSDAERIAEQQLQSSDISKSDASDLIQNKYIEDTSSNEKIHAFPSASARNEPITDFIGDKQSTNGNNVIHVPFGNCGEHYGQS